MVVTEGDIAAALSKLTQARDRWSLLADGDSFGTKSSLLQPVIYNGAKAFIKIPLLDEERRSGALMHCWNGNGAAKVLKYDTEALLMERAAGEKSLRQMVMDGQENEANRIICSVIAKLHAENCKELPQLVPLQTWFSDLRHAAVKYGGVFSRCADLAVQLLNNQTDIVALHGDIHYDNILYSGNGDWIAIDPKALLGERAFDFANLFCNPTAEIATDRKRLKKQVKLIAEEAGLDARRLLQWIIAWSGLSATWILDDGGDAQVPITVAENAWKELVES